MTYDDERVIRTRTEETQVGAVPPAPPGYGQPGYGQPAPPAYPPAYVPPVQTGVGSHVSETRVERRRGPGDFLERLIILLFGIIQVLLILRIVLLLVAARQSNSLVAGIYGISDVFVAPFRGVLGVNEVNAGRSELDVAAIVALVGWTLLELLIIAVIRLFRPRGAYA